MGLHMLVMQCDLYLSSTNVMKVKYAMCISLLLVCSLEGALGNPASQARKHARANKEKQDAEQQQMMTTLMTMQQQMQNADAGNAANAAPGKI